MENVNNRLQSNQRYVWLRAMWACLEKGEDTTGAISTAHGALLECGLKQSDMRRIPTHVVMHVFTFLDIMDYICNVSLVCKSWSLNVNDILFKNQPSKFKLLQEIIYNSLQRKLTQKYHHLSSKADVLFEMETSIAFALLYTAPCRVYERDYDCFCYSSYPPQTPFFTANKDTRRFSYFYLLHYIYLYRFGGREWDTMVRMYILLARIVFVGTMGIGLMMELFYDKWGAPCEIDPFNTIFERCFGVMFHQYYSSHEQHVQHKPMSVMEETVYNFVKILTLYSEKWKCKRVWLKWHRRAPHNILNKTIADANKMFA
eukprot:34917_1